MEVPLYLILGVLLALTQCNNTANTLNLRQIREAPPPSPAPIHNITDVSYRDLNKINDNPKTENVDSKKFVNNVHSYEELPLKLAKIKVETQNGTEETESSNEEFQNSAAKEKYREDSARAIDVDSSKFWSDDFHSKNVFTLAPAPDIQKFHEPSDLSIERPWHLKLTTPTTKIFDEKFKETVESVEQNIEDEGHEHDDADHEDEQDKDADLSIEDPVRKSENESLEFLKTKAIVNNETVDKNSIHKDVNFEQTKKLSYENVFNDTKVYGEETPKGEHSSTERTTTSTLAVATTRKNYQLKELVTEKSNTHILNNNIETGTTKPIKGISTSTTSSTTKKDQEELQDNIITTAEIPATESHKTTKIEVTTTSTTPVSTSLLKANISDQENHVIPFNLSSDSTPLEEASSDRSQTTLSRLEDADKKGHTVETRVAIDELTSSTTTEMLTSTEILDSTTFESTTLLLGDVVDLNEGTTIFIVDNGTEVADATTDLSTSTEKATTIVVETTTFESGQRTSKSLENSIVTEQLVEGIETTIRNTTKVASPTTESTVRNELDSTTVNEEEKVEPQSTDNTIEKVKDPEEITTEGEVSTSTLPNSEITIRADSTSQSTLVNVTTHAELPEASTEVKTTVNSTEKIIEIPSTTIPSTTIPSTTIPSATIPSATIPSTTIPSTTAEVKTTTQTEEIKPTTTEYAFVHIENAGTNHTTLLPEILSPNLNYSTTTATEDDKIRKIVSDKPSTRLMDSFNSSKITSSTTTTTLKPQEPMAANVSSTSEGSSETSTEDSYSQDGGGNKGKIAAIAISSVGAVCLVLLAGLLYVMKKRQKRLKYGPRCRPVSLDDYSIDNLSVYNSVRRKGAARLSKRSFGNPAFDDPVAPTHPLNFPALAKFSVNYEDIKAEFEEIPQISARTSELPDGCETKNRYANVIPLPETRVFLKSIDGYPNSDYINANYVTGPKNVKGYYIASQGPMQNTVDDFWRMIWEQQAKVILMLTHLVENGLEKCVDYLPESEVIDCSRIFGDFQIILKKQEVKDKYIITTLQLKNMVSNSWREVTHFWYLGWPEKGVPAEGNSLIAFLIEARSYMKAATIDRRDGVKGIQNGGAQNEHNPVVVHCSPGTGRTGVAIACDIAIREFETTRLVDIPKIVYKIRRDRAAAVQTKEQYIFIYKVVSLYATKLTGEALEHF